MKLTDIGWYGKSARYKAFLDDSPLTYYLDAKKREVGFNDDCHSYHNTKGRKWDSAILAQYNVVEL
jgi:hypothetical protein